MIIKAILSALSACSLVKKFVGCSGQKRIWIATDIPITSRFLLVLTSRDSVFWSFLTPGVEFKSFPVMGKNQA